MTLRRFQKYLKQVNPKLRIRQRGYGDIVGLFAGLSGKSGYICRMSKGELHLSGWRQEIVDPEHPMLTTRGNIAKRGRKTVIMLLKDWRWVKTHKQKSLLLWGLKN